MEENHTSKSKEDLLLKIRELEKEVKKLNNQIIKDDRYGLNWIDVPEGFEQETEDKIPILEEVKDKAITNDDGKPTHILIEGDNYHALTCLNYTHKGKVDVIYIDPPYNTGNDGFTYKDKRLLEKHPNGVLIKKEHPLRHSSWLSFMNKRLKLAKELLSERGVIFISIDSNEFAQLKLLCNKVFGEQNYICDFIRKTKSMTGDDGNGLNIQHEYLLVFSKKKNKVMFTGEDKDFSGYKNPDNDVNGLWCSGDPSAKSGGSTTYFAIKNPYTNKEDYPPIGRYWAFSESTLNEYIEKGRIKFKKEYPSNQRGFIFKRYKNDLITAFNAVGTLFAVDNVFMNQIATTETNSIFGESLFDYPKPCIYIEKILKYSSDNSSIILDFFAGSGTTMHATMNLNAEDGGKRQCILVQENESDICDKICYERNKRVMQGYSKKNGEEIEGLGNSLKYYRTSFVGKHSAKNSTDDDRVELSHKAGYLLALGENTLEEKKKTSYFQIFDSKDKATAIYFKEDLSGFDEFVKEVEEMGKRTAVYIFSWDNAQSFEYNFEHLKEIEIKSIPQAILEIYKSIND